jgi:hypothetical protein
MPSTGNKNLRITMAKGFQMKFPNGVVASVQWGTANYCEQRSVAPEATHAEIKEATNSGIWGSDNAEVMAWLENGEGVDLKDLTSQILPDRKVSAEVLGFLDASEVLDFLNKCAEFKP